MKKTLLPLPVLSLAVACTDSHPVAPALPNIVIIYADDLGYGDMSCQNAESKIQTPHLDAMAASGMRFTDGHSSSGVSTPSRYALLTGAYHWRRVPGAIQTYSESVFEPGELTMPRMLKESGYQTAMIGKWHLGWNWNDVLNEKGREHRNSTTKPHDKEIFGVDEFDWSNALGGGPCSIGFDYYYGHSEPFYPPFTWIENDRVTEAPTTLLDIDKALELIPEGNSGLRAGVAIEGWDVTEDLPTIRDKSIEIIENAEGDKPLFLYCALSAPHVPIAPSKEYYNRSEAGPFGDFVVQCDDVVGDIVAALKSKGIYDNTIIIFSSDNGPESFAFKRITNYDHNSSNSLRGLKRDMWEGGHRVPYIVSWGSKIAPAVCNQTVSQVDIMATLAAVVGYKLPEDAAVDSYNMLPLLMGDDAPIRQTLIHNTKPNLYSLRKGDWLYIDSNTGTHTVTKGEMERYNERFGYSEFTPDERKCLLYNLRQDQMQRYDLSEQYPEKVAEMKSELEELRHSPRTAPML